MSGQEYLIRLCVEMIAVQKSQGGLKRKGGRCIWSGRDRNTSTAVVVLDTQQQCGPSTGRKQSKVCAAPK